MFFSSILNVGSNIEASVDSDTESPVFTSGSIAASIAENSGSGQVVYTATTTDDSSVTYSIDNSSDFTINSSAGAVTLTANPDYETQSSYTFTVTATDSESNSSTQTVTLAITNDTSDDAASSTMLYAPTTTLDFNSASALEAEFDSEYSTNANYTPLWSDNNTNDDFSFTQNETLFYYDDMYHLTGDTDYIDRMCISIEYILDNTDERLVAKGELTLLPFYDSSTGSYNTSDGTVSGTKDTGVYHSAPSPHMWDGTPVKGWSSYNATGGTTNPRCQILTDAQILGAIATCCDTILSSSALSAYHADATTYMNYCADVLADHSTAYATQTFDDYSATYGNVDVSAYYYTSEVSDTGLYSTVLAFNHPLGAHLAAMVLDKHSITSAYLHRAQSWLDFMRLDLCRDEYTNSDGTVRYDWRYTIDAGGSSLSEDLNHGGFYLGSVFKFAYENGYCGVTKTEMTRYANALYYAKQSDGGIAGRYDGTEDLLSKYLWYVGHQYWLSVFNSNLATWITDNINAGYTGGNSPAAFRAFSHMLRARDVGVIGQDA